MGFARSAPDSQEPATSVGPKRLSCGPTRWGLTGSGLWRNCGVTAFNMCNMVNMWNDVKSR